MICSQSKLDKEIRLIYSVTLLILRWDAGNVRDNEEMSFFLATQSSGSKFLLRPLGQKLLNYFV